MLTDDFPFLLSRHVEPDLAAKLRVLANDLERIASGTAPTAAELAKAPLIFDWRCVLSAAGLRLLGRVSGHPKLGDTDAMTSQLWAAGRDGTWIRTLSRFYRLGPRWEDARRQARHEERPLSITDVRHAVLGSKEELSAEELERATIHEAGHIVLAVLHGGPVDIHAVVAGGRRSAGFVVSKNREPTAGTLEEYRLVLQGLLAGRAAEELELGAAGSGAGGSEDSDLAQATRIAAALVGSFGHVGPHPLIFIAERHQTNVIMNHAYLRSAAHQELAAALEEAKRILVEHRGALKEVAARLRARGRIDGHDVEQVLTRYSGNARVEPDTAGSVNR